MTRQICPRSLSYNSPKTSRRIDEEKNLTKNSFPAYGSNPLHDCQILVKQSSLIGKKVGTVPNEKRMEKTRFAEYSQRHDGTISTIYPIMERNPDSTYVLSASFTFHCCALLVPGTISYLEIRTCNYFKEHHSFRVMYMA